MEQIVNDLKSFFNPTSVAIIGASSEESSIGWKPINNLLKHRFQGNIFPVNPKYSEILGLKCYPSIEQIEEPIDLALIVISQKRIEATIKQCIDKQVKHAIVFGSGFAEVGEEGEKQQERLVKLCQEHGLRFTGPNCIGSINVKKGIPLGFSNTFEFDQFISGEIGLVSQSGAVIYAIFDLAQEQHLGFSYISNTGNQADLNVLDFLEFMVFDDDTNILGCYIEALPEMERLKKISIEAIERGKPLVIHKSGNSELGKKAAMSHTGSLTGSSEAFEVFSKKYGITLVNDTDEFLDALKIFNRKKYPHGNRVAVISTSGAMGIMVADQCEQLGLEMVSLSEETVSKIEEVIPYFGSSYNPIDMTAHALNDKDIFRQCLEVLVSAPEVDMVMFTGTFGRELMYRMAADIIEVDKHTDKPIISVLTGSEEIVGKARGRLEKARIPTYNSIQRATLAIKQLVNYQNTRKKLTLINDSVYTVDKKIVLKDGLYTEPEVKKLLKEVGIESPSGGVVTNADEAITLSKSLQYPLIAKIVSKTITHKSDVGGVIFPIQNEQELIENVDSLINKFENLDGILLEEMIEDSFLEMIVGVKKDPNLGIIMMCGLGGIYVEILKDVALRLSPLNEQEALEMIKELKIYPLFDGYRKGATYDVKAFAQALVKVSRLVESFSGDWSELEINPLIVRKEGKGVVALDGLITK